MGDNNSILSRNLNAVNKDKRVIVIYEGKSLSKSLYLDNEEEDKTNLVVMKKSK